MPRKNRYYHRSKISEAKFRQLVRLFALDLTATNTAEITGLSVSSREAIYQLILTRIAEVCAIQSPFKGEIEVNDPYFGPKRIRGKRSLCAGGKTIVFGLLKQGNCIYTEIVTNTSKTALKGIIRGKVDPISVIHTDKWRGYDGLVEFGIDKHFRVNHSNNELVRGFQHINGIESFWSYAKHSLAEFHGVTKHTYALHLKETEFRFNHRNQNLYLAFLKLIRDKPL